MLSQIRSVASVQTPRPLLFLGPATGGGWTCQAGIGKGRPTRKLLVEGVVTHVLESLLRIT